MPKYENKVTLGNLIALLTFVILFVGSIASATSTVSRIDGKLAVVQSEQENIKVNYREKDQAILDKLGELRSDVKDLGMELRSGLKDIKRAVK